MTVLHVTNGDMAADRLRDAAVGGDIVTLVDVLHEGPAPAGLSDADWWACRARFVADAGWDTWEAAHERLRAADERLGDTTRHDEVVLWFEHDLNCQLQLIRVLDRLARAVRPARLALICIGVHPDVPGFAGLAQLTGAQMAELHARRQALPAGALDLAREAWAAFRSPDPTAVERVIERDTSSLPFLAAALRRHLEQFPATTTGLSRTERQILEAVAAGVGDRARLFKETQQREAPAFMGDTIFFTHVGHLLRGPVPLLAGDDAELVSLTAAGQDVLAGRADRVGLGGLDRWLGGVHLRDTRAPWRWDGVRLRRPPARW